MQFSEFLFEGFYSVKKFHYVFSFFFSCSVGPLPDMILPTSDCRTVLIALEAEAFARNGTLVNPEGGVGLLKFQSTNISTTSYSYKRLNFHNFDNRYATKKTLRKKTLIRKLVYFWYYCLFFIIVPRIQSSYNWGLLYPSNKCALRTNGRRRYHI